jgi:hypothetical protein
MQKMEGGAIVMIVYFKVVVEVYSGFNPFRIFIGIEGQRQGGGTVQSLKHFPAGLFGVTQQMGIKTLQTLTDSDIDLRETEESAVT